VEKFGRNRQVKIREVVFILLWRSIDVGIFYETSLQ
jgi:hypothetical protein